MKLIVGLGNPGHEYELTRHNAGFQVLDRLSTISGGEWKIAKNLHAAIIKGRLADQDVVLAKPVTYMNLSGGAVVAILQWFKITPADLYVVHDDVSLDLGRMRIQSGGSAGGQHGVESTIASLGGNKNFARLKFGVGPDPGGAMRADYVLKKIPEYDRALYEKCIVTAGEAMTCMLVQGVQKAMNTFNGIDLRPPPPSKDDVLTGS
jgi:PTH1 family peptidyl-tRNA hydrolase